MKTAEVSTQKAPIKLTLNLQKDDSLRYSETSENNTMNYDYQDAFAASLEYFKGDELAANVFLSKYALKASDGRLLEKTPRDMHRRIASELARIEAKKFKNPYTYEQIFNYLDGFKQIIPQGSSMFGIGNKDQYVTLSNCYVVPSPADSYGGICNTDQALAQISKRRGGVGLDISKLRPAGMPTKNSSRTSTGIGSFMERFSNTIREVGQDGRRGALMITCSIHHPEALTFATIKHDKAKVTGANISFRLTDEFLDAVRNDTEYEQRWPVDSKTPVYSKMVSAREVWNKIIEMAHADAEPGVLFWDNIIRNNPADCYAAEGYATVSTNPCSEIPLSAWDSCRLLVINLMAAVNEPYTSKASLDLTKLKELSYIAQRLMDDIVDLELEAIDRIIAKIKNDPEGLETNGFELTIWENIKHACEDGRRTGTGITGMGDMLASLGIRYGSLESIDMVEKVQKNIKLATYRASVDMAEELGGFPIWNPEKEKGCPFLLQIKEESPELYEKMQKYGRRNIALLTIAPTGTVSILTQTSSGIEPVFMLSFTRRKKINPSDKDARVDFTDEKGDKWQEFKVYHPGVQAWMDVTGMTDVTKSPWYGCCAEELNWVSRVELQAAAQRHIDHAISSTLNLPEDVTVEKVAEIYTAAWEVGCKGITVYRKNCRTGVLVENKKEEEAKKEEIAFAKRAKKLKCDIYHTSVKGDPFFVTVGLAPETNTPYEVFGGRNGFMPKSLQEGFISKAKRGSYQLMDSDDKVIVESITEHLEPEEEALTRMVSMSLRHGVDLEYVVHQLEKVPGDLFSLSKALTRSLKKYIKDGAKVKGEECEECKGELIRQDGCIKCASCGWTKCS